MPTLQFMPWCRIVKPYLVGEVNILPFRRYEAMSGLDELTAYRIRAILASYKDMEGHHVSEAALIRYNDRPLLDDLSQDEVGITEECVDLACFSGLANRDYFNNIGAYCNSDCFILYGQKFSAEPYFAGITSRRRDGRTLSGRFLEQTVFSVPVHVDGIQFISLDESLLTALVSFRDNVSAGEWVRWQNAIRCFNQANTDNDAIRYQVEWVLLCSAFEHILEAKAKYEDVAERFADALIPHTEILVGNAKRSSLGWTDKNKPLRYEWMKEFYRIRGDFAHGKLQTQQPAVWNPLEHLVLASIGFPLLVRRVLAEKQLYAWEDEHSAQVWAFEKLMDEEFLNPPPNQKSSADSVWSRLLQKERSALLEQKIIEKLSKEDPAGEEA